MTSLIQERAHITGWVAALRCIADVELRRPVLLAVASLMSALASGICMGHAGGQVAHERDVYIHATLIDTAHAVVLPDMALTVWGGRIEAVGPTADIQREPGDRVFNLHQEYVLPGLINTHVHLATDPHPVLARAYLRRELFSGVTAVRDMAGDARLLAELKREAQFDEIPAPDIYYAALMAGPAFFTDPRTHASSRGFVPGTAPWMRAVTVDTNLQLAVAEARGTGATAIKIYADLPAFLVRAITQEAHRQGLLVWTHAAVFPASPLEIAKAGVDVMSHAAMLAYEASPAMPPSYLAARTTPVETHIDLDAPPMSTLFEVMKQRGIILDATLDVGYRYPSKTRPPAVWGAVTHAAYLDGVMICAGTDDEADWKDPDSDLDTEIIRLVEDAGLTPMDALRAATSIAALAIGQAGSLGAIEAGRLADFAVFRRDPLTDIHNIRTIELTVKHGIRYERSAYRPFRPPAPAQG